MSNSWEELINKKVISKQPIYVEDSFNDGGFFMPAETSGQILDFRKQSDFNHAFYEIEFFHEGQKIGFCVHAEMLEVYVNIEE